MKISRVVIKNWRSIKEVDFRPSDITILVGANNAGKTNILSAINFLLGDRWPMPGNLDDTDYYLGDRKRPIHIELEFENAPYTKVIFNTSYENYNLRAFNGATQARGFNNEERARIAFAYVDASRSFEKQFAASRYALFGQAIKLLHSKLSTNTAIVEKLKSTLDDAHKLLKTEIYLSFEQELNSAFSSQLKTSKYDVQFEFKTIDETNLYRGLYPSLVERGVTKTPLEVGSGVRNLLVLALFNAFAKTFKGDAILGIEEPELYLHPHAQRSLKHRFEELAQGGAQIFISSHCVTFLDVTKSDRIVLVSCNEDDEGEVCTQVQTTSYDSIIEARKRLHPNKNITKNSLVAFLQNFCSAEMAEPYFSRLAIVVEGASEREALPILLSHCSLNLDEEGISIVSAEGKTAIDTLVQVYQAHDIPVYVIFDNDKNKPEEQREYNKVICRLLGITETNLPLAQVGENFSVIDQNWEYQMKTSLDLIEHGLYERLHVEAKNELGITGDRNKPIIAKYIANRLVALEKVPPFVGQISLCISSKLHALGTQPEDDKAAPVRAQSQV